MTEARRLAPILLAAALLGGCAAQSAFHRARDFAEAQDWDRAVYHYSKALSLEPRNIEYRKSLDLARIKASQHHVELAKSYVKASLLDLAIAEYRVAGTLDPTNSVVADSLANVLERKKELEAKPEPRSEIERAKDEARESSTQPVLHPGSTAPLTLIFPPNTKVKDIYVALGKAAAINMLFDNSIRDQETFSIDIANISFKRALDQVALANRHFYKVIDDKTLMIIPDNPQKRRDYEDHVIKTFYLSNANPNDVVNTLRGLLDARRLSVNAPLNAITIRDTPAKIAVMERVVESNDKPPSEVVIDVEILEVSKSDTLTHGIGLSSYSVEQRLEQNDTIGGATGLRWSSIPFINASNWLLTFPFLRYNLEKNSNNVRTVARPSLRALDGKQVTLRLGDQVPIEASTFSVATGGSQPITRNFQFRDIGTNIDITPRVHHNSEVTLTLQVEVTSIGEGGNAAAGIPPTFGNRRINTEIRLKDGETNLLAGLFTSAETKTRGGIPILSDIPILRSIFATNSRQRRETDIVLTLTPHIVRTPNIRKADLEPFYVGTESNVGGVGDVGMGSVGAPNPFTPPGDDSGGAPRPVATPPRAPFGGRPSNLPGQPPTGTFIPGGQPTVPTPFVPSGEPPSPSNSLPSREAVLGEAPPPTPAPRTIPGATSEPPVSASPTPAPVAPAVVALSPGGQIAAVGKDVSLDVIVSGAVGVGHAPLLVTYNPAVLEAVAVVEGDFLRRDGKPTQFLSSISPGDGRIVIGLSRIGRVPGIDGAGTLATLRFRAKAAGSSPIAFGQSSLRTPDSSALPATFVPATVTVP